MFQDMFGEFTTGRVGRGKFVFLTLLLGLSLVVFAMLIGGGIGVFERLGGTADTPGVQPAAFGTVLAFFVAGVIVAIGQLNLVGKRARDIGWSAPLLIVLYLLLTPLIWIILAVMSGKGRDA